MRGWRPGPSQAFWNGNRTEARHPMGFLCSVLHFLYHNAAWPWARYSASLGLPFLISATKRQRIGRCGQEVKEAAASVLRGHHHIVSCLGVILASQMLSFCSNIKTLILFTICKLSREVKPYTITLAEPYYSSLFYLHICHVCISIRKYVLIYRSKVTLGGEEISFILISVITTLSW